MQAMMKWQGCEALTLISWGEGITKRGTKRAPVARDIVWKKVLIEVSLVMYFMYLLFFFLFPSKFLVEKLQDRFCHNLLCYHFKIC